MIDEHMFALYRIEFKNGVAQYSFFITAMPRADFSKLVERREEIITEVLATNENLVITKSNDHEIILTHRYNDAYHVEYHIIQYNLA